VSLTRYALLAGLGEELDVRVTCTSGTYVRALARDLGRALGVGAHLTALRRTRVGPFGLNQARTLEQLAEELAVVPLDDAAAASFPRRELTQEEAVALSYGKKLAPTGAGGTHGAFDPQGRCIGLVEDREGPEPHARPTVVFAPAT
jgi:tRNA pseudouridine55 synthase